MMKRSETSQPIMGNSKVVRNINRAVILNIIREKQPISRVQIARITGLNKSTVSSIVPELIDEGLVYEAVEQDKNVGRNPLNLRLKLDEHFVGGISIESEITRMAIADIDGSLKLTSSLKTETEKPGQFIARCIEELISLRNKLGIKHLKGIGVCVPGIVDQVTLQVSFAPRLGWEDFEIGQLVMELCPNEGVFVVDNDVNSSAFAELWFGEHDMDLPNFVYLFVGNGIGTGIILDKKLMRGAHNASGEFGHMTLFEGGELCSCGNYGCWEAYASNLAIIKRYNTRKWSNPAAASGVTLKSIISLAKQGEPEAREVLLQAGHYIGLGISNIIKAVDPGIIIIGGEISSAFDIIYPDIMQTINRRAFFERKRHIRIFPTSLRDDPRLLGAATLAIQELFSDVKITL